MMSAFLAIVSLLALAATGLGAGGGDFADVFSQDAARFRALLHSPAVAPRIEGVQGLSNLKHWPSEDELVKLLSDPAPAVQREALLALGRVGTAKSVPLLIAQLDNPSWELRQNVWLGLGRMTAQSFPADQRAQWEQWWKSGAATNHARVLLNAATNPAPAVPRAAAWWALPHFVILHSDFCLLCPCAGEQEFKAPSARFKLVGPGPLSVFPFP